MKVAVALMLVASVAAADPPGLTPVATPISRPHVERIDPPKHARRDAWIATGATAAIIGMGVFSLVRMRQASDRADEIWRMSGDAAAWTAESQATDRWFHRTVVFGGLTVVSAAITGILWGRTQPDLRISVSPQGGMVGYAARF